MTTFDPTRPFNDPTTACCGRDAADCDCPPALDYESLVSSDLLWDAADALLDWSDNEAERIMGIEHAVCRELGVDTDRDEDDANVGRVVSALWAVEALQGLTNLHKHAPELYAAVYARLEKPASRCDCGAYGIEPGEPGHHPACATF